MQNLNPVAIAAFAMELSVAVAFGVAAEPIARAVALWPRAVRIVSPALFVVPYVAVSISQHALSWNWFALYAAVPVLVAWLLDRAAAADAEQRGNWRDGMILLALGLAVDLRWFESAWPVGLRALNELLLVDVGLYGFLAIRRLQGTGFDFCPDWGRTAYAGGADNPETSRKNNGEKSSDWKTSAGKTHDWKIGLRELVFLTPPVLILGLALEFIPSQCVVRKSCWQSGGSGLGVSAVDWNIFLYRGAGRTLLSRLGAEFAGTASGAPSGAGDRVSAVRIVTFQ